MAHSFYEAHGYAVCPGLVSHKLIDRTLEIFRRDIVPSSHRFYRQNSGRYERNVFNNFGYIQQSFLDIHDYKKFPEFSKASLELFFSDEILNALSDVTGHSSFNLMQSMLFDANTATQPHQDWWYLDTVPAGGLTAAWIALEDIDERAGRFYVLRDTMNIDLHSDTIHLPHMEWIGRMWKFLETHKNLLVAPALKKGDVLFWNSRTIHGALPTLDQRFSRKSLTAHFIPTHLKFGNLFKTKDYIQYQEYKGFKFYRNQPDYSFLNKLKSDIKLSVYNSPSALKFLRKFQKS